MTDGAGLRFEHQAAHSPRHYYPATFGSGLALLDLEGNGEFTPPLAIAKAYDRQAFGRLLSEGAAVGGQELGLMKDMAVYRFSNFNHDEVSAIHEYLHSR